MIFAVIFSLICFSVLLIKAADLIIVAVRRISRKSKTGTFAISALILALGTSLPELFVGITSALESSPNISLGVIIGSNIANLSLVVGFAALVAGRVEIYGGYVKKDIYMSLFTGCLPIVLLLDKTLNRIDGLILLSVYGAYSTGFFKERFEEIATLHKKESIFYRLYRKFNHVDTTITKDMTRLFIGLALLLFSADMIVKISKILAEYSNIPIFVISLVVLAFGTVMPELAVSFRSLGDRHPSMFLGNILGSIVVNSTLIIGMVSLIEPINIVSFSEYFVAVLAFIVISVSFILFTKSKSSLDRKEAFLLVIFYLVFIIIEFVSKMF